MFSLKMNLDSGMEDGKKEYDVVVIGAGPAGASAAIYVKRNGYNVVVLESGTIGGQLSTSTEIENYLGFSKMTGMQWSEYTKKHLDHLNIPVIIDKVVEVNKLEDKYEVKTMMGKVIYSKAIIFATGADHRHLDVSGEKELEGKGVSYCATCDGYFFKGKTVGVVGGGNTAIEYVLFLAGVAKKVYLIHRREGFRAEKIMIDRAKKLENVEFMLNYVVEKLESDGSGRLAKVILHNTKTGEFKPLELDGLFISIGTIPNSALAKKLGVELDEKGYIKVDDKMQTSMKGVFACGDVVGRGTAQAINAAAQGMTAGLTCSNYLQELLH